MDRVWDCHWHLSGNASADEILRAMDSAGIERICLFGRQSYRDIAEQRVFTDEIAAIAAVAPDRVYGLIRVDPRLPSAADEIERAIAGKGLRGVKMLPDHWEPCDEAIFPVYARIEALGVPLMMHSGILFGHQDSSRFCRPVLYEALLHFPALRFSLAHIGWPWTDECLAVAGRFRAAVGYSSGPEMQMYVDITPGTPPAWRKDALAKALAYVGPQRMVFGSDATTSGAAYAAEMLAQDRRILCDELGVDEDAQRWIFWDACADMFRERDGVKE